MNPAKWTHKKSVERGLTIYKTGMSRYWRARLYDRSIRKYVTKTTMETDRQEASIIAREWKVKYLQGATSHLVEKANW